MATLHPDPYDLPEVDFARYPERGQHQKAFDALVAASDALPDGEIVGALLRWQRADGYAYYLVTKARPLTLQHVPFGDAWTVEPALIRGLTKADVMYQVQQERRFRALFARRKDT